MVSQRAMKIATTAPAAASASVHGARVSELDRPG